MCRRIRSMFIYTIAEISKEIPPYIMLINCTKVIPGNILTLKRKNPARHNENKKRISRILYAKTTKIFLENNQFFI
jgi:acyl-[acyl carrier protein]--UDP-N-acetylglucosamine O-acyltransferase